MVNKGSPNDDGTGRKSRGDNKLPPLQKGWRPRPKTGRRQDLDSRICKDEEELREFRIHEQKLRSEIQECTKYLQQCKDIRAGAASHRAVHLPPVSSTNNIVASSTSSRPSVAATSATSVVQPHPPIAPCNPRPPKTPKRNGSRPVTVRRSDGQLVIVHPKPEKINLCLPVMHPRPPGMRLNAPAPPTDKGGASTRCRTARYRDPTKSKKVQPPCQPVSDELEHVAHKPHPPPNPNGRLLYKRAQIKNTDTVVVAPTEDDQQAESDVLTGWNVTLCPDQPSSKKEQDGDNYSDDFDDEDEEDKVQEQ